MSLTSEIGLRGFGLVCLVRLGSGSCSSSSSLPVFISIFLHVVVRAGSFCMDGHNSLSRLVGDGLEMDLWEMVASSSITELASGTASDPSSHPMIKLGATATAKNAFYTRFDTGALEACGFEGCGRKIIGLDFFRVHVFSINRAVQVAEFNSP